VDIFERRYRKQFTFVARPFLRVNFGKEYRAESFFEYDTIDPDRFGIKNYELRGHLPVATYSVPYFVKCLGRRMRVIIPANV